MKLQITQNPKRRIAAILLAVAAIVIFFIYPDSYSALLSGVPFYAAYFLPLFLIFVVVALSVEVSTEHRAVKLTLRIVALFIGILAIYYASEVLIGRHFWYLLFYNPTAFFYGLCVLVFILAFFFALTGSAQWSLGFTAVLIIVYCFINYFVLQFRGTPFIPLDIFAAGTVGDVISGYEFSTSRELVEAILAFSGVFVLSLRLRTTEKLPKIPMRIARISAAALSVVFFLATVTQQYIYDNDYQPDYWDQTISAEKNGNVVNFIANIPDSSVSEPQGYSLDAVYEVAARYESDSASSAQEKPDVVLILGESWADFAPAGYAETNQPVMPFISSLQNEDNAEYKDLIVSTAGGGTSRTEFQVLTGASVEYGIHAAPFQYNVTEPIPNVVESFKQLDYNTVAMHTGTATAWGRDAAFPLMGFDEFIAKDDFAVGGSGDYVRQYLRDSVMYDRALEVLEETDAPTFIYAITIQTHGGYDNLEYESSIHIEEPAGEFSETEQFMGLLHESDRDLAEFIGALKERERPTLVLFFGDHIPYVEDNYMEQVVEPSDPLWRYKTFFGIWANYALPDTSYEADSSLGVNYLSSYLMLNAGLPLTGYQKFLLDGAQEFPVVSIGGFVDAGGNLISVNEAKGTDLYFEQSIMQYNFVMDRENMPDGFFYLQP